MDVREKVGRRGAKLFKDGDLVNLGIGMPTVLANYIPEGCFFQQWSGCLSSSVKIRDRIWVMQEQCL